MKLPISEFQPGDIVDIKNGNFANIISINKNDSGEIVNFVVRLNNEDDCVVLTKEQLYQILLAMKNSVYTHNCQFRLVCGRLGSIASMMALGNTLATTISSNPGAGALASLGNVSILQHYFAETKWISEWYRDRGMDEFGFALDGSDIETDSDEETGELFEGEEEIDQTRTKTEIEFAGIKGEVDSTKDQQFEEV